MNGRGEAFIKGGLDMLGNMDAEKEFRIAIIEALSASGLDSLVETTFEDGFIICHKCGGARIDFENAVGELGEKWRRIANKYGLRLVGRNDSCAMLSDDHTLRFKLVNNEATSVKRYPNMNRGKGLLLTAALFWTFGVQAYTLVVTNGMQSLVVPDSVQYVDQIVVSSSYISGLNTIQFGKSFRSFLEGPNFDDVFYWGYNPEEHIGYQGSLMLSRFHELTWFWVSSDNKALRSANGVLYSNKYGYYENGEPIPNGTRDETVLLLCPRGKSGSVTIIDGTVRVGECAFRFCDGLTQVTFPDTVTSIGDRAFARCANLRSIVFPDSVEFIDRYAFSDCAKLSRVEFPEAISIHTNYPSFRGCTNLSEIVFRGIPNLTNAKCFEGARKDCTVYVPRYSTGWGVNIPGTWNGLRIEYISPQSCKHNGKTSIVNRQEATCSATGYSGDSVCCLCGEIMESGTVIPALGHNMGAGVVTKEPTVSEAGVMSYYCTRCGILMKTESISMLDILQVLGDCLGGLPYGSVTLGSDEVQWLRDGEITHDGKGSLRLMGNGNDSESSIQFAVNDAGQLSFWWKVSSEYDAEDDSVYDYAYLTVDGVDQGGLTDDYKLYGHAIGGDMGWTNVVIDIYGGGNHTIAWTYKKDAVDEIAGFEDCVWLGNVVWRPVVLATFALGDGVGIAPEPVAALSGSEISLPAVEGFCRDGYVFAGWSDGVYLHAAGDSYMLGDSNVVFTATWIRITMLTFALDGGTGALPTAIHEVPGRVVSLPDSNGIERDGYVFAGWSDGVKAYAAGESYTLGSSDVIFTATWIRKSILTFALNGGTGDVPAAIMVVPDTVVALPSALGLCKPKHSFAGWSDGSKTYAENENYTVAESDVEFTALWTAKTISKPTIQSPNVANGGVVTDAASVTLVLSTDTGATLHYTLDGSIPTAESPVYTDPIESTDFAVKIKVIAICDDYFDSDVAEFSFTRKPYTLAECLGLEGVSDVVVTAGGDGEAWHRVLGDEAHDGTAGLRSGAITHNQTNWVEVCVHGAGTLSFWWKASSEVVRGKVRDGAAFFVDGELQAGPIGGTDGDWARVSYEVAGEGPHTFRWEFGKSATDSATDIGEDCAWLDDVAWIVPSKVSDVMAKQRYPWNGLVDITCNVSGIAGVDGGYKFAVAAVIPGSDEVRSVSQVWVVRDGVKSANLEVGANGSHRLLWDARADLGEVLYSNMVVRVTINYIVKYNPGMNGSETQQTADKIHGIALTLNGATFTRIGYTQTGWATGDGGAKAYDIGDSYTGNAPIVLYPYWSPNAYAVTYKPGANGTGLEHTESKWHDIALTLKGAIFTRNGYTQTGWATSDGGAKVYDFGVNYTANSAITLYPYWTKSCDKVQLWKNGPYWATTNIGAEEPHEYGYYFWWGDTVGYKRENNAWVASDGSLSNFSFYTPNVPTYTKSVDTLRSEGWITSDGVLAPEHDAAHVHWGGDWRIPTNQELDNLISKCDLTWTAMNGVYGYVVRGRGDYVSASIFLPCAGIGDQTSLGDVGSEGYYCSSVPSSDSSYMWFFYFRSSRHHTNCYALRWQGYSVRPVQDFAE